MLTIDQARDYAVQLLGDAFSAPDDLMEATIKKGLSPLCVDDQTKVRNWLRIALELLDQMDRLALASGKPDKVLLADWLLDRGLITTNADGSMHLRDLGPQPARGP
jgi:hypothetical protein